MDREKSKIQEKKKENTLWTEKKIRFKKKKRDLDHTIEQEKKQVLGL